MRKIEDLRWYAPQWWCVAQGFSGRLTCKVDEGVVIFFAILVDGLILFARAIKPEFVAKKVLH